MRANARRASRWEAERTKSGALPRPAASSATQPPFQPLARVSASDGRLPTGAPAWQLMQPSLTSRAAPRAASPLATGATSPLAEVSRKAASFDASSWLRRKFGMRVVR